MTLKENFINNIILTRQTNMENFFKKLLISDRIIIENQTYVVARCGPFEVDSICVECTVLDSISFDDGRLNFKKGDNILFNVFLDPENFGLTNVEQHIKWGDGSTDYKDLDYISFSKEYNL